MIAPGPGAANPAVVAARAGDPDGWEAIYREWTPVLMGRRWPAMSRPDWEDLVAEAWARAFLRLGSLGDEALEGGRLLRWLTSVLENLARDRWRRLRYMEVPESRVRWPVDLEGGTLFEFVDSRMDSGDDVAQEVERRDMEWRLSDRLARAEAKAARACRLGDIIYRDFKRGASYMDCVVAHGVTMGTVKSRMWRYRRVLAAEMRVEARADGWGD